MFDPLNEIDIYHKLREDLLAASSPLSVSGSAGSQGVSLIAALSRDYARTLIVTRDEQSAGELSAEAETYTGETHVFLAGDMLFRKLNTRSRYLANQRTEVLKDLTSGKGGLYFASVEALMDPVWSAGEFRERGLMLSPGMTISMRDLTETLYGLSYERTDSVEAIGEFAVRGGIVDIYPAAYEYPVRIEFFDDEIESLKSFNTYSQRSLDDLSGVSVYPLGDPPSPSSFQSYFGDDSLIVFTEPLLITERGREIEAELRESLSERLSGGIETDETPVIGIDDIWEEAAGKRVLLMGALGGSPDTEGCGGTYRFHTEAAGSYKGGFNLLIDALGRYTREGYRVTLMTSSGTRASRIAEEMREQGLRAYRPDPGRDNELQKGEIEVVKGSLAKGYIYSDIKYLIMTEADMFGRAPVRRVRKKHYDGIHIGSLGELSIGDYVVHDNHGVGIYRGIEHIARDGAAGDFIKVEYADGGNLYLPVTKLDLIQKYGGAEGSRPRINRLSGKEWQRTRERVARSVGETAKELVKLYAERLNGTGYRYEPDTEWQKEFEEMFPFEETPDQLAAIESVKADMESDRVMDRLISGDVGYGKTEIAMRAAFKAAAEGKQTAMLVPTTILAEQHFETFKKRFENFPVNIAVLSRFNLPADTKKTIEGLSSGKIDIVIGTHRLLSDDVRYKDLGLLIVDEEQRFGVAHKDKIKQLKHNVEALSLSATPIPRTLHMSLSGIRDLSILDEPPFDRVPVETYVLEYHDEYVREAVLRELRRGGQVFYVYNRVVGIEGKCMRLRELIPGVRIEYAHGQMPEKELRAVMMEFVRGDIDVLVSTTIIESGLDIPNANTIIVDGAENIGLSQLYQLKGRVGRSSRTAYAFFMYRKDRVLREEAEKRLRAISEFTGFGSGIKIAMRDLEIRGAGNVLGTEQHGDIGAVGYDLYVKLLSKAVREERGIKEARDEFDTAIDCAIDAFIPPDYIESERQRLEIYKRIAEIDSPADGDALIEELSDRFSPPPPEVINLIDIALLKARAHRTYVTELRIKEGSIVIRMFPEAVVDTDAIPGLVAAEEGRLKFMTGKNPEFIYLERYGAKRDARRMMAKTEEILSKISLNT